MCLDFRLFNEHVCMEAVDLSSQQRFFTSIRKGPANYISKIDLHAAFLRRFTLMEW